MISATRSKPVYPLGREIENVGDDVAHFGSGMRWLASRIAISEMSKPTVSNRRLARFGVGPWPAPDDHCLTAAPVRFRSCTQPVSSGCGSIRLQGICTLATGPGRVELIEPAGRVVGSQRSFRQALFFLLPVGRSWGPAADRGRREAADQLGEQFGEGDCGVLLIQRANNLYADRKALCCATCGGGDGGQAWQRGVRDPKRLIGVGPLTVGCGDAGPRIVRKRGGEIHRAQENVDIVVKPNQAARAAIRRRSCSITADSEAKSCSPGYWNAKNNPT
jgi:hypothetical protein